MGTTRSKIWKLRNVQWLTQTLSNSRNPDSFLSKQIATIRLHHWFVYTAHGRPKSAQTRAATAKVISRNIKKLLIHRVNEAMSLSVSLPVLLFGLKNHFGLTRIVIFGFLWKKIRNLSFFPMPRILKIRSGRRWILSFFRVNEAFSRKTLLIWIEGIDSRENSYY